MASGASTMARGAVRISKRLVLSYIFDWILIVAIAALGVVFNRVKASNKRPFILQDPNLTFPYKDDTVTILVCGICALLAPAGIMFVICMVLVPGAGAPRGTPQSLIWRRKLWEWNTAWMGIALSCATAFMFTEGLKDLAGKPRPHTLAVCNPNTAQDVIDRFRAGPRLIPSSLDQPIPILVTAGICQETDPKKLRDTFASWPSGHSSFAWAGLLYFTLFLCAKLGVTIPFLNPISYRKQRRAQGAFPTLPKSGVEEHSEAMHDQVDPFAQAPRNQAAAPPVYLLIITAVPIGTALFICVSRWFDYHHFAFDIISGSIIGIVTAYLSFRYYHMPIRRGAGWSWGARSRNRAFWIGVGRETYVGDEGWEARRFDRERDIAMTSMEKGPNGVKGSAHDSTRQYDSPTHYEERGNNASLETERQPLNSSHQEGGAGRLDTNRMSVGKAV